jgi:hypothetical protein
MTKRQYLGTILIIGVIDVQGVVRAVGRAFHGQ